MAYLAKKGKRYYICETYKVPVQNKDGKTVLKKKIKWTKSAQKKELAKIELAKFTENQDRNRIGLEQKDVQWETAKDKYLQYSQRKNQMQPI